MEWLSSSTQLSQIVSDAQLSEPIRLLLVALAFFISSRLVRGPYLRRSVASHARRFVSRVWTQTAPNAAGASPSVTR